MCQDGCVGYGLWAARSDMALSRARKISLSGRYVCRYCETVCVLKLGAALGVFAYFFGELWISQYLHI